MKQKKIIYVLSQIDKAIAFEWISEHLSKEKYKLSFVVLNYKHGYLETYCKSRGIPYKHIQLGSKFRYLFIFFQLWWHFLRNRPDIVHFHLFEASFLGLPAAWLAGVRRRMYTRHHSISHHMYHPHVVKIDKFCNRLATDVVAISEVVKQTLIDLEYCSPKKVKLIYHGFDLNAFSSRDEKEIERLQITYNPSSKKPVIGVISRFIELKGVNYIIQAMEKVLKMYPDALFLFFGSEGNKYQEYTDLLKKYPSSSYKIILFENNITQLYKIFDVFVHVPINPRVEAFGQIYVEALASGVPMVCTLSGIANEFIEHKKNAWVVPYKDAEAIAKGILHLLENKELREKLIAKGKEDVRIFALKNMISNLENLYDGKL